MNSFIFTGRIGTVTPSTTKAGKPYFSVEIEPEGDPGRDNQYPQERIPVITSRDCSQLYPGTEVIVTGKLAGRRNGQYLNLQMSCADICPVPVQAPRRQPQATYDQRESYQRYDSLNYQQPPPPPPPAYRQQAGTMPDAAFRYPQQPPPPPPAAPPPPPEYRDDEGNKIPF